MAENMNWPELRFACNGGGCVIVRRVAGTVVITDGKNPYQPGLVFSNREYREYRRRILEESWPWTLLRLVKIALRYVMG